VRRVALAGHILWLPPHRPAKVAMQWVPDGEEKYVQVRPGDRLSRKINRKRESVMFAEWPVIGVGGKALSPNTPSGVGGSKSSKLRLMGVAVSFSVLAVRADF